MRMGVESPHRPRVDRAEDGKMTDSIEDSDVRRVDRNVDPTALTAGDLEDELPDDFSREAKSAFAERVAEQRSAVRESVDLSNRITQNPASGQPQLRGPDGRLGPSTDSVEGTEVQDNGDFVATLSDGSSFKIDTVDLNAGSSEGREDAW